MTKLCPNCKETKALNAFYPDTRKEGRFEAWCKKCKSTSRNVKVSFKKYWPHLTLEQSEAEYTRLFAAQNGECDICFKHQTRMSRALCVDHNHQTGEVRGLLCHECNLALGKFQDSTDLLELAIQYLNKSPLKLLKEGTQC